MSHQHNDRRPPVDIRTLTKADLVAELHAAEARLRISKTDLMNAQRYGNVDEAYRLRERISRLKTAVQRIRVELTRRHEQAKADFVAVARRELDPQTFARIEAAAAA